MLSTTPAAQIESTSKPIDVKTVYTTSDIPALSGALTQPDIYGPTLLEVARAFRRILSLENPPAKEVINSGVLPEFVQMLTYNDKPEFSLRLCGLLPTLHLLILPRWWLMQEPLLI